MYEAYSFDMNDFQNKTFTLQGKEIPYSDMFSMVRPSNQTHRIEMPKYEDTNLKISINDVSSQINESNKSRFAELEELIEKNNNKSTRDNHISLAIAIFAAIIATISLILQVASL